MLVSSSLLLLVCAKYAYTQASRLASIFGFLVCYFIHVHRVHTHAHIHTHTPSAIVKLSIFWCCLFLLAERTCVWRSLHALLFLRRKSKRDTHSSTKTRCSAFPIFTMCRTASQPASELNTRYSTWTKCKIWKWLKCLIACYSFRVQECM